MARTEWTHIETIHQTECPRCRDVKDISLLLNGRKTSCADCLLAGRNVHGVVRGNRKDGYDVEWTIEDGEG